MVVDTQAKQLQAPAVDAVEVEQHGDVYSPRTSHVMVAHGGRVYLFGGSDRRSRKDDMYVLDTATTTWSFVEPQNDLRPGPRSSSQGIVHGDRLYVFGGRSSRRSLCPDFFAFDFGTHQWEELPDDSLPASRVDFVMAASDHELLVFGGYDGNQRFNDLFSYSFADCTWHEANQLGPTPSRRFGHSGVIHASTNRLIVFGGWDGRNTLDDLYALDVKSYTWEKVSTTGKAPSHRYRHTAVIHGDSMLVFGGIDKTQRRFNDLHRLDLLTNTWTEVEINTPLNESLIARTFHEMIIVNDKLLVLGGYDGEKRLNSLHALDLTPKEEKQQEEEEDEEMLGSSMHIVVRL